MSELRIRPDTEASRPVQMQKEGQFDLPESKNIVMAMAQKAANAFSSCARYVFRTIQDYIYPKKSSDQAQLEKQPADSKLKKMLDYVAAHEEELALFSFGAYVGYLVAQYMTTTGMSKSGLDQKIPLSPSRPPIPPSVPPMYSAPIGPKESWPHSLEKLHGTCPNPNLETCPAPLFLEQRAALPAPSTSKVIAKTASVAANTCPAWRLALPAPQPKLSAPAQRLLLPAPERRLPLPAPEQRLPLSAPEQRLPLPAPEQLLLLPAPQAPSWFEKLFGRPKTTSSTLPPASKVAAEIVPTESQIARVVSPSALPTPANVTKEAAPSLWARLFPSNETESVLPPASKVAAEIAPTESQIARVVSHSALPTPANATETAAPSLWARFFPSNETESTLPPASKVATEIESVIPQIVSTVSHSALPAPTNATEMAVPLERFLSKAKANAQPAPAASGIIAQITSAAPDSITSLFKGLFSSGVSEERVVQQAAPSIAPDRVDRILSIVPEVPDLSPCTIPQLDRPSWHMSEECVNRLLRN